MKELEHSGNRAAKLCLRLVSISSSSHSEKKNQRFLSLSVHLSSKNNVIFISHNVLGRCGDTEVRDMWFLLSSCSWWCGDETRAMNQGKRRDGQSRIDRRHLLRQHPSAYGKRGSTPRDREGMSPPQRQEAWRREQIVMQCVQPSHQHCDSRFGMEPL